VLLREDLQQRGLTGSVGSHHSAAGGGGHIEVDGFVEDEHVGLGLVGEAAVLHAQQRDVGGGQALGVLQRGGGGEGELALQRDLLLVVLLGPLLLVVLLTAEEGRRVNVLVLDQELLDLLVALLVLSGLWENWEKQGKKGRSAGHGGGQVRKGNSATRLCAESDSRARRVRKGSVAALMRSIHSQIGGRRRMRGS
jgi:hypothetical protein